MDEAAEARTADHRDQRWLALSRTLFAFNAGDRREAHLAVLACFDDALFDPALNLEQLTATLRPTAPELAGDEELLLSVLGQLTSDWGLLEPSRDDSATYSDPGEFRRRTLQWALTPDGQAAVAGLNAAADRLAAVASLQPAALDAIAAALSQVAELAADPASSDAALHVRLAEAEPRRRPPCGPSATRAGALATGRRRAARRVRCRGASRGRHSARRGPVRRRRGDAGHAPDTSSPARRRGRRGSRKVCPAHAGSWPGDAERSAACGSGPRPPGRTRPERRR
ncbi:MAG TPA: DUF2397 family protein [Egibacteraceae bacterium]|jgi:hypothetical protein|nr:DUF2397 family protein [Egibacteraceae bacterium]